MARLLRGYSTAALENVALWHERDISHSSAERVILPDACTVLHYMLVTFTPLMEGLEVNAARMRPTSIQPEAWWSAERFCRS